LAEAALVIGSQEPSTHPTQAVQKDSLSCSNMEVACHLVDLQAAIKTTCIWYPRFHVFPVWTKAKQINNNKANLPSQAKMPVCPLKPKCSCQKSFVDKTQWEKSVEVVNFNHSRL